MESTTPNTYDLIPYLSNYVDLHTLRQQKRGLRRVYYIIFHFVTMATDPNFQLTRFVVSIPSSIIMPSFRASSLIVRFHPIFTNVYQVYLECSNKGWVQVNRCRAAPHRCRHTNFTNNLEDMCLGVREKYSVNLMYKSTNRTNASQRGWKNSTILPHNSYFIPLYIRASP